MFQWDAVDTGPDLGGSQNVLKTFEMAIRHNSRTTRSKLERVFCRWVYFYLRSQICFWPSYGGGGATAPIAPAPYGSSTGHGQMSQYFRQQARAPCIIELTDDAAVLECRRLQ